MKMNGQMKKRLNNPRVLEGHGKEYSEVAEAVGEMFTEWISNSGITESEFETRLGNGQYSIEETSYSDGNAEIKIYAGGSLLALPLVYLKENGMKYSNFLTDVLLLLLHVSSKYNNKEFEQEVRAFAKRLMAENKMSV